MNRHVHLDLTRQWAREVGFSEAAADALAAADWACDSRYIHTLADKRFHWPAFGSQIVWRRRLGQARRSGDLTALGEALHAAQDSIGHGFLGHLWHWPGIDRMEHRSASVRLLLERRSKSILTAFMRRHPGV